jgi:hypothetical protein
LGGLKLYRLLDTQVLVSFFGFKKPGGQSYVVLCKVCSKSAFLPLLLAKVHPASRRPGPSPLYQPFDYHPPFVPLWPLTLDSPTSCLPVLFLAKPCRISHQSTFSHNQLPTFGNFQHHFLIQRLSTNFIQPSRYPYPAIIHILRHLDFGHLSPLLRAESTIPL